MNSLTLEGRLGKDAFSKPLSDGRVCYGFSIAVNEDIKKGNEWQKETSWVDCVYTTATAMDLKKGEKVIITGKLKETVKGDVRKLRVYADKIRKVETAKPTPVIKEEDDNFAF